VENNINPSIAYFWTCPFCSKTQEVVGVEPSRSFEGESIIVDAKIFDENYVIMPDIVSCNSCKEQYFTNDDNSLDMRKDYGEDISFINIFSGIKWNCPICGSVNYSCSYSPDKEEEFQLNNEFDSSHEEGDLMMTDDFETEYGVIPDTLVCEECESEFETNDYEI